MFSFIQRQFHRVSSTSAVTRKRLRNRSRNRTRDPGPSLALESLEARLLLAELDLGNITNPATLQIVNGAINDLSEVGAIERFKFSLERSAVVIAELSDLEKVNGFNPNLFGQLRIVSLDASGDIVAEMASKVFSANLTEELRVSLRPGQYAADFISDTVDANVNKFDFAIHADTAPGQFSPGTSNPLSTTGRNLGVLLTASGNKFGEFIGAFPEFALFNLPAIRHGRDDLDVFLFDVVKQGTVTFTIDADNGNTRGDFDDPFNFSLVRDLNNDGVFQLGTSERIRLENISPDEHFTTSQILSPGRYGLVVEQRGLDNGGLNYQIQTSYSVADGAGNTLAAARNAGTVGVSNVAFSDYLSPNDPFDIYKFTTVAGGPFVFEGTLSGMATGSNFELDFIRADGVVISSSVNDDNFNEVLSVPYTAPGTYFVRVRRTAGEGIYTLQFFNRNTDRGGNTLPTASVLFLFGFKEVDDHVSSTDTVDIYKFTLDLPADFDAHLSAMPAATNANLSLIRDTDGDGVIDPGETLSSSSNAGNASESIARTLAAGTYFVRVLRVSGAPSYNLRLVKDSVGNTLATALPLSPSGGEILDFLGPEDDSDVYRFTLGSTRLVRVSVGQNNEPLLVRLGQDTNGDGAIGFEGAELRINKTIDAGVIESINLSAGTYFLLVNAVIQDEGTTYGVILNNDQPDFAGNTLATARDLGTLRAAQFFNDFVGTGSIAPMDDLVDFYRFTLGTNGPFRFHAQFNSLTGGNANLQLIRDANLNGAIEIGEIVSTTSITGTGLDILDITLNTPGTYYLRVFRVDGLASYLFNMSAISLDTAGNSLSSVPPPRDLGPLAGTINSPNHFVGDIDRSDFFSFSVTSPGELRLRLSGANQSRQIGVFVIRNADNDLFVDPEEILALSVSNGESDILDGVVLPVAGTYHVRVLSFGGEPLTYSLELTFSSQTPFDVPFVISSTVPTDIKAVRFDKGGEGIAYHDTTSDNNGNQPGFRSGENIDVDVSTTGDPQSSGRRVTNTAPGEFLEFTIDVENDGLYDFDARVSSPDLGATFHIEIDGVSIAPPVAVPDTNGADNMVTISAASNVFLEDGPHILRLAIDTGTGVNNNFAGSFNFITIRPASAGTIELTPPDSVVTVGERTQLSLGWTVPVGGWTVLKQVDFRLRDDLGRLIWIRFDESKRTFSLYNANSGKFGLAKKVGSNGVLNGPLADLYLSSTTVAADGPAAPTVVFTFDFRFKSSARGHYTVEAAASDDVGHNDPFLFAGTIEVV